jgi:hypothetical protein
MKLVARCPVCGYVLQLSLSDADKRKRCPKCTWLFKVPEADTLKKALEILETACTDIFVDEQGNVYA